MLTWRLENGKLVILLPDGPTLVLDTPQLIDLIEQLATLRGVLGLVPQDYALGQICHTTVPNPGWATEPEALTGDSIIHLRDPRYGWLHYLIPREQALRLGDILQIQANCPVPLADAKAN